MLASKRIKHELLALINVLSAEETRKTYFSNALPFFVIPQRNPAYVLILPIFFNYSNQEAIAVGQTLDFGIYIRDTNAGTKLKRNAILNLPAWQRLLAIQRGTNDALLNSIRLQYLVGKE